MAATDDQSLIRTALEHIRDETDGIEEDVIERTVRREFDALRRTARVQNFVPIIAERHARDRLVGGRRG